MDTDGHDCLHFSEGSIKEDVINTLLYSGICDEIYEKFIETHPDNEHTLHNFLSTYEGMVTSTEYTHNLHVLLWTKDWVHGATGCCL